MALEIEPECEQFFRICGTTCDGRACDQPQCDRGRARPKAAGAGNALREREAVAVRRGEPREGPDGKMVRLRFSSVLGELELVPEIGRASCRERVFGYV